MVQVWFHETIVILTLLPQIALSGTLRVVKLGYSANSVAVFALGLTPPCPTGTSLGS